NHMNKISKSMTTILAYDSNSDDSNANESDSDVNKSNFDEYFKSDEMMSMITNFMKSLCIKNSKNNKVRGENTN
ncbi:15666_t:CDS:1, partial [Funneliformis geosporum]